MTITKHPDTIEIDITVWDGEQSDLTTTVTVPRIADPIRWDRAIADNLPIAADVRQALWDGYQAAITAIGIDPGYDDLQGYDGPYHVGAWSLQSTWSHPIGWADLADGVELATAYVVDRDGCKMTFDGETLILRLIART